MQKLACCRWTAVVAAVAAGVGFTALIGTARAQQDSPPTAIDQAREAVDRILRDFAKAAQDGDVEAALKLFASEEDMRAFLPEEQARKSANEIRSRLKLSFHEFTKALKDFGKHDVVEVNLGRLRRMRRGELPGNNTPLIAESGYVSFARDTNYLIELRFNVGGIMQIKDDRWAITNMVTRADAMRGP